jgi:hypothetical protein
MVVPANVVLAVRIAQIFSLFIADFRQPDIELSKLSNLRSYYPGGNFFSQESIHDSPEICITF